MNLKWNVRLQLMNKIFMIAKFKIWIIMLSLMKKHQRSLRLLLKWFHKCKVHIKIMKELLKYYLKVVLNLIIIIITILIHKQNLHLIINRKSMLNKLNINNHLNLLIMIKILIKVCIMEIVCLLKRDIVQSVIKIKSYVLNTAENAIDV